jgi:phospholipase C
VDSFTAPGSSIGNSPIKHIVVIIPGRHSFDNYFGTFPNADGFPVGVKLPTNPFNPYESTSIEPFHLENIGHYKPSDDPEAYRLSFNNGSMNAFVYAQRDNSSNERNVMGYFDNRDIPYYWEFATEYVLAQRFFSPSMRSDLSNSLYVISGEPYPKLQNVPAGGLQVNSTIFDQLESNKISWKVYVENYGEIGNLSSEEIAVVHNNIPILGIPRFTDNQSLTPHIDDLTKYFSDIRNSTLSAVTYIYFTNSNDSPSTKVVSSQELVANLVYSLMRSNYWNNSAVIVAHNEPGGWYDHVSPPMNNNTNELYGFRVPAIIISPYAKKGFIDNTLYDASSILRFIEYNYNISAIGKRDGMANNMLNAFNFTMEPREPLYLREISREKLMVMYDSSGVTITYVLSLLVPISVTIYWYLRKLNKKSDVT